MNDDTNLIDISMLQQLQDQFCCADHLYLMCVDKNKGVVTKPFGTEELLARIRAVLRSQRHNKENAPSGKFQLQDLIIDYDKRQVFVGKTEIDLTQTEYNIMALLSIHAGKVLTYAAIIRAIWGYSDYGSVKKLQVNMKNIRKKMGVTPGEKRYIINELGVGYRMLDDSEVVADVLL